MLVDGLGGRLVSNYQGVSIIAIASLAMSQDCLSVSHSLDDLMI